MRGNTAYVNDPISSKIYAVDIQTGEITTEADLTNPANEMTSV